MIDFIISYILTGIVHISGLYEMNQMTPPFRHRIRNTIPDSLRTNTLPFGREGSLIFIFTSERRKNILCLCNRGRICNLRRDRHSAPPLTTLPPCFSIKCLFAMYEMQVYILLCVSRFIYKFKLQRKNI